ncbi:hypothetical protein DT73_08855 [Mangrovibacter sp. MFB070]|nr:hypothetical protein DT73_08855 [Mangrovibacter sp. MFB070]
MRSTGRPRKTGLLRGEPLNTFTGREATLTTSLQVNGNRHTDTVKSEHNSHRSNSNLPAQSQLRAVSATLLLLTPCARRPQGALARQARLNDLEATPHTRLYAHSKKHQKDRPDTELTATQHNTNNPPLAARVVSRKTGEPEKGRQGYSAWTAE